LLKSEGIRTFRALTGAPTRENEVREIALREYPHPIYFRPGTTDTGVIIQNLIRKEYGHLPSELSAEFIVDAGGNIGDSAVFFLNRFRDCRVVVLEPSPRFLEIANRNLANYPNATLVAKGLWSEPARLTLSDNATGSSLLHGHPAVEVECVDVAWVLDKFHVSHIDILKMDIEGAELDVIVRNSESWLTRTRVIIVELHGPEIESKCVGFLERRGFRLNRYRSLFYFYNDAFNPKADHSAKSQR
jgi:FkbM family methyltransferase